MKSALSKRTARQLGAVLVAGAVCAGGTSAWAQGQTCLPPASGVPFQSVPYPDITVLNHPNWVGSAKRSYSLGVPDDVAFHGLTYDDAAGKRAFLMWEINHGQNGITADDTLVIGYGPSNDAVTGSGIRIVITLPSSTMAFPTGGTVGAISPSTSINWSTNPTNATDFDSHTYTGPTPDWLNNARLFTIQSGTSWHWVVQMVVPLVPVGPTGKVNTADITAGIPYNAFDDGAGNTYNHFYMSYVVNTSLVLPSGPPSLIVSGSWPRNFVPPPTGANIWNIPQWGDFQTDNSKPCQQGIVVGWNDVSTDFNDTDIHTGTDPTGTQTNFRLNIHNGSAVADVPAAAVQAQFRVADWGSQTFTDAEWLAIPNPTNTNTAIIPKLSGGLSSAEQVQTITPWTPDKCTYANEFTTYTQAQINAANGVTACTSDAFCPGTTCNTGTSRCTATLTASEQAKKTACGVLPPDGSAARLKLRDNHECVRAEVQAVKDVDLDTSSVYRNMNFRTASRFQETAKISTKGLKPLSGGHDVYIWIERRNMPQEISTGVNPDCYGGDGGPIGIVANPKAKSAKVSNKGCDGKDCGCEGEGCGLQCNYPYKDPEADVSAMPQFRVHVYDDLGTRAPVKGTKTVVLSPQVSYGYLMAHFSTTLYGWSYAFAGPGITPIGQDLYKVHLPNDGVVQVTNVIEAQDQACLGPVADAGKKKMVALENDVKEQSRDYWRLLHDARINKGLQCSDLHHLLMEVKLQGFVCDQISADIAAVVKASGCNCPTP